MIASSMTNARLLVTDDEVGICDLLREALTDEGFRVETACDPAEALERLRETDFDLLITDICMPGGDGIEMLGQARKLRPDIAVIVMTAYADTDKAVRALRQRATDFIQKPFSIDEVSRAVRQGLAARDLAIDRHRVMEDLHRRSSELALEKKRLSEQIAEATQQASVFQQELEKDHEGLDTLSDLAKVVTSVLDLDKALKLCLALLNQRLRVNRSSVMMYDPLADELEVVAVRGVKEDILGQRIAVAEGVAGYVAKTRQPVLVGDIHKDGRFDTTKAHQYATQSFMSVPLVFQSELLGVINANDRMSGAPFDERDLAILCTIARQISAAVANARLYDNLKENSIRMVEALANTLEAKDVYTCGHSERVTEYAVRLGRSLGLPKDQVDVLRFGGLLHDIGKIGVPEDILGKPDRLTDEEFRIVQQHPIIGEHIIGTLDFLSDVRKLIRHHHERCDGKGYPDGLDHKQLATLPRILGIADAFDAMTSERPYRSAMSTEDALAELRAGAGFQFDAVMVERFTRLFREEPAISTIHTQLRYPAAKRA